MAQSGADITLTENHILSIQLKMTGLQTPSPPKSPPLTEACEAPSANTEIPWTSNSYAENVALFLLVQAAVFQERLLEVSEALAEGVPIMPSFMPPPNILFASEVLRLANPIHVEQHAFKEVYYGNEKVISSMYGISVQSKEPAIRKATMDAKYRRDVQNNFYRLRLEAESSRRG